jgi:SAM-dependent methyltransferase
LTDRSTAQRWLAAAALLARFRDVLDGRPAAADVPHALVARDWAPYLLALDDAAVDALEASGVDAVWPSNAPDSLLELVASVRAACSFPRADNLALEPRPARRFEKPRKHTQIDAFARVVIPLATNADRVVDVGSGHGHLTRELADRLGMPVLGLERDAALADKARALAKDGAASFAVTDVLAGGLALSPRDCVVGLHACGELGDAMVVSAARVGASLALVGCCLQKRRSSSRAPLSECDDVDPALLDLPKSILGLSNLTTRNEGVEASRLENLRARERRLALHRLLGEAGFDLPLGAEIAGLNRRAAHADLEILVARAFAVRERPSPRRSAVEAAERWASMHHAHMRRLALPRSLLGRLLEVFVLLDRARYLEEHGFVVTVAELFPMAVSARNLSLVAAPQ